RPGYLRQRSHSQRRGYQTPSGNDSRLCRGNHGGSEVHSRPSGRGAENLIEAQTRAGWGARVQIKNGVEEVFIPAESVASGYGYMNPDVMDKTVKITNEFFDVGGKVPVSGVYTNQFIPRKVVD